MAWHIDVMDHVFKHTGNPERLSDFVPAVQPDPPRPVSGGTSLLALFVDLPGLHLCLPLTQVLKVLALMALQEIPSAPGYFAGLLNLGGEAVPVIDLGWHLQRPAFAYHTDTPVVLCEVDGRRCGLIVESVLGVRPVKTELRRVEDVVRDTGAPLLSVFESGDQLVFVLDTATVLADVLPP